ncbi:MAG: TRAP transporter large permease [Moorellaceae bacterium]
MITNQPAVILLLASFLIMIILRIPIAFALGIASVVTTIYLGLPLAVIAQGIVKGINVFVLLAIPFFILAGEIMSEGGISTRLVNLANALVGRFRGGLAMVNVLASMFFGGISGSSVADTSSIGSLMIPMMKKKGYEADFATSVTMAGSVQGILIPPSHNMIIYSLVAGGVSVGKLFLAGMIPGVLLGISLMIFSYILAVIRRYPVGEPVTLKTALVALRDSVLGLLTVVIVVVGVISGIFTATESAALAAVYAFVITFFVYREIPLKRMGVILSRTLRILAIVMILIGTSTAFGWLMAYLNVPAVVTKGILGISENRYVVMLIINAILLFLGMIMDMSSLILITTPILLPIVTQVGVDPVHFGVIMMLNLGIGLLTPPVGGTLFVGSAIGGVSLEKLSRAMLPFYAVMVGVLLLITYIPGIVMYMPNRFMP